MDLRLWQLDFHLNRANLCTVLAVEQLQVMVSKWQYKEGAAQSTGTILVAARSQRQEEEKEEEELLRKEAHDGRVAMEYAQSMLEWGRMLHAHFENIQKFMESVVQHTGMPAMVVPPPPPPPPAPPIYANTPPSNPSPNNACTDGSSNGIETPDEHRVELLLEDSMAMKMQQL